MGTRPDEKVSLSFKTRNYGIRPYGGFYNFSTLIDHVRQLTT